MNTWEQTVLGGRAMPPVIDSIIHQMFMGFFEPAPASLAMGYGSGSSPYPQCLAPAKCLKSVAAALINCCAQIITVIVICPNRGNDIGQPILSPY